MDDSTRESLIQLLECIAGLAALVWVISFAIRSARKHDDKRVPPPKGFYEVQGPGRFKVSGVDRETKMDVTDYIDAASAENAKAKAELSGILVTAVERD